MSQAFQAPAPVQVKTNSKFYSCPILNEEMDQIAQQINSCKSDIAALNANLNEKLLQLNALSMHLLELYIQQTGSFPS